MRRFIARSFDPATPAGRLGLQLSLNGAMLSALVLLSAHPWAVLAILAGLFALTVWLHGRGSFALLAAYGLVAWAAEAWIVGFGGVWHFAHHARVFADGGLFGVPFYMAPAWALTGAALLAMAPFFPSGAGRPPQRPDGEQQHRNVEESV